MFIIKWQDMYRADARRAKIPTFGVFEVLDNAVEVRFILCLPAFKNCFQHLSSHP